jgi:hypothetical protein
LSNPIFAIPNVASINPVGLIIANMPIPYMYVFTIISLPMPTVSANGDIIGIESTAIPEDEGIKKDNQL